MKRIHEERKQFKIYDQELTTAPGYYLADIVQRKYYYCGIQWDDVKRTLREELEIGRLDPLME